jgi:hypothetical protein
VSINCSQYGQQRKLSSTRSQASHIAVESTKRSSQAVATTRLLVLAIAFVVG